MIGHQAGDGLGVPFVHLTAEGGDVDVFHLEWFGLAVKNLLVYSLPQGLYFVEMVTKISKKIKKEKGFKNSLTSGAK
jgi:hypothetical protein